MNLVHLKYVIEIEKCKSISKAANNLHMGQPNLSRGIRELEDNIGIKIFDRSSKGITVTQKGEEFLLYAKAILDQVDYVESFYKKDQEGEKFSISVVRANYIFEAFSKFVSSLGKEIKISYKEDNSRTTINDIIKGNFNIGIIRYSTRYASYFDAYLKEKGLASNEILDFTSFIIINEESSLAKMKKLNLIALKEKIEVSYGDIYIPNMHITEAKKQNIANNPNRHIRVFDRASVLQMLQRNKDTYFSTSPLSKEILTQYHLVQKQVEGDDEVFKDVLIARSTYRFRDIDKKFLKYLTKMTKEIEERVNKTDN